MDAASECTRQQASAPNALSDQSRPHWARILENRDPKIIWKSLNWKGTFDNVEETHPSDDSFKDHFEHLLNENEINVPINNIDVETAPYIPVLDDSFSPIEMEKALENLNQNKSYSGICPGILKILPVTWFIFLLTIFNLVFTQTCYPLKWCYSKLVVLFKSGDKMSCDNYCGISIMDTLAKI